MRRARANLAYVRACQVASLVATGVCLVAAVVIVALFVGMVLRELVYALRMLWRKRRRGLKEGRFGEKGGGVLNLLVGLQHKNESLLVLDPRLEFGHPEPKTHDA